jgi:hypothetical protein
MSIYVDIKFKMFVMINMKMDVLKGISSIMDDVIPHGCDFTPRPLPWIFGEIGLIGK